MRYTVLFRAKARDEALDAADYIARTGSPEAAQRWYEGLETAVRSLESMPARCGLARENESIPGIELRQLMYASHRLIFIIRDRTVHVLHLRHAAQANADSMPETH
ncbi:MAG: type II toxin-antitoxin system RelE/ParE family toxin [Phycisphaeraceae bacterium]|nr:MAG: type II toxin-antitoxin system RelE/ParE family toxin [Phycisphaeraceae bacterium]